MTLNDLFTKYSAFLVIGLFITIPVIFKFGILFFLLLMLFYFLLYHAFRIYSEIFRETNPKFKMRKMLANKVVFDNNIWMDKSYDKLFDNIKYLCKKEKFSVVLFKIQLEEIANIRNKAKVEDSPEFQMADLAIKRIEDYQKSKILKIEDKLEKKEAPQEPQEELKIATPQELTVKITQEPPKPKKPPLPADPKEAIHKSFLIDSLTSRLSSKKEYTYVSLNPELRVKLRAFLIEHSDVKIDIVEVKTVEKQASYIDKWRLKRVEKFLNHKAVKKTKKGVEQSKKLYEMYRKYKQQ